MNNIKKIFLLFSLLLSLIILISTIIAYNKNQETYLIAIGIIFFLTSITSVLLINRPKKRNGQIKV